MLAPFTGCLIYQPWNCQYAQIICRIGRNGTVHRRLSASYILIHLPMCLLLRFSVTVEQLFINSQQTLWPSSLLHGWNQRSASSSPSIFKAVVYVWRLSSCFDLVITIHCISLVSRVLITLRMTGLFQSDSYGYKGGCTGLVLASLFWASDLIEKGILIYRQWDH